MIFFFFGIENVFPFFHCVPCLRHSWFCDCRNNNFPIWILDSCWCPSLLRYQNQIKLWRHRWPFMCMNAGTCIASTHTYTGMCASAVLHAQYILYCLSCSYSKGEFFQSLLVVLIFHLFINVINNVSCYIPLCDMLKTIQTVIQFISSLQGVVRL